MSGVSKIHSFRKACAALMRRGVMQIVWLATVVVAGDLPAAEPGPGGAQGTLAEPAQPRAVEIAPRLADGPDGGAQSVRPRLEFRRLLVPHDRPLAWPTMRDTYLPVPAARFEQLAAELASRPLTSAELAVHIRSAVYTTRATRSPVLQGEARLVVEQQSTGRAVLRLGQCNLAIQNLRWDQGGPPPVLGRSSTGEPVVLVDRSGELRFDWLLRGSSVAPGHCDFALALPPATANQVSCLVADTERIVAREGLTAAGDREGGSARWWHVTLGSGQSLALAVRASQDPSALATTRVRQALKYDVTGQGIEISADLEYERYQGTLDTFEFVGDVGFELIEVRIGAAAAIVAASPARADGTVVYTAHSPTPGTAARQLVKVTGQAQLVGGARPLTAVRPAGAVWQSGRTTLTVKSPLWLESLDLSKCRQAGLASLPPPAQGDVYEFEWFDASATITASIVPRPARWQAAIGTRLDFKDGEIAGRSELALQAESGETFTIAALIEPAWMIDTVEAVPSEALADWSVDPQPSGDHQLTVRLARPLRAEQALSLVVHGRRPRWPVDQEFPAEELGMLSLPPEQSRTSLFNLQAAAPWRLDLGRDPSVLRVDSTKLTAQQLELVAGGPESLLVALNADNAETPLALRADRPGMTSDIRVSVTLGEGQISERYEVACVPQQTRVRKVWVRFSQPRVEPPAWRAENVDGDPLAARLLEQDEQRRLELPPGGEVWEITLPRATSAPFKLFGARRSSLSAVNPISLLSLPEADQQIGRIDVKLLDGADLEISAPRLRGLSLEGRGASRAADVVAAYAYDPRVDADPTAAPAITLLRKDSAGLHASAVIWDAHVDSTVAADGAANHTATYQLELAALNQLKLRLPADVEAMDVRIDGRQQPVKLVSSQELLVALPADARYVTLVVELRSRQQLPLRFWSRCAFPLPLPVGDDIPMLAPRWSMTLPAGLAIVGAGRPGDRSGNVAVGWRERLFGDLARKPDSGFASREVSAVGDQVVDIQSVGDVAGSEAHVVLANWSTLRVLGWGVFWISVAVVWWRQPSGRWCMACCCAAAALALVLPNPYWLLANRIWIGLLVGLVSGQLLTSLAADRQPPMPERPHPTLLAGAKFVLWLALAAGAALATQRTVAAAEAAFGEIPQVLIPARNGKEPTGDRYLVPEVLWREMQRAAAELARQPQGWLLAEGDYRVALEWARNGTSLRVARLVASYDLHVFSGNARIVIPFGEESAEGAIVSRLDGQRIVAQPATGAGGVEFVVVEAGVYRLELQFEPPADGDVKAGLSFRVPGLPHARARVELPPDAPPLELITATGPVTSGAGQQLLTGQLGTLERVELRWPENPSAMGERAIADLEQLTSVTMQPGAVVVQVRFRRAEATGSQTLQLETSDDLRPLPASDEARPATSVERTTRSRQVLTLPLVVGPDGVAQAEVTLLAERASGVGQFAAPWIKPLGGRVSRHWLAVSATNGLELGEQAIEPFEAAGAEEFVAVWGAMYPAPSHVYVHSGNHDTNWLISSRPRAAQVAGRATLSCQYARSRLRLSYSAQLQTTGGSLFRHQVEVPPGLHIETLSVTVGRAPRRARWALDERGRLTIFLAAPLSGGHELSFVGTLPLPGTGEQAVPVVRLASAALTSSELSIWRHSSVLVSVTPQRGLRPLTGVTTASAPVEAREVARFEVVDTQYEAQLAVEANRPEVKLTTATVMDREASNWRVRWHAHYEVAGGTLDRLRVWLPPEVGEAIEVNPPGQTSITPIPGERRRLLTVAPAEPVRGKYVVELRASVAPRSGRQVAAPHIESADTAREERYLVLPGRAGGQGVAWQTRGLARAELPSGLAQVGAVDGGSAAVAHGILANDFEAVVQEAVDGGDSQVRLADFTIELLPDGRWQGLAAFDLDPADRKYLPLTVPGDCELVQTWVEQVPGCLVPNGLGNYRLLLHTAQIPQRVEVLFRSRVAAGTRSRHASFVVPWPGDLPIERSLWRVGRPWATDNPFRPGRNHLGASRYEIIRSASLSGVVDTLCDALNPPLEADLVRAAESWLGRLRSARATLQALLDQTPTDQHEAILSQLEALDQASARLQRRLPDSVATTTREMSRTGDDRQPLAAASPIVPPATAAWLRDPSAPAHNAADLRAVFQGGQPRFDFELQRRPGGQRAVTWALAAVCVLLIPVALGSALCRAWGAWLVARPPALGMIAGAIWALWLAWPFLGIALVAVSLSIWSGVGRWFGSARSVGQ